VDRVAALNALAPALIAVPGVNLVEALAGVPLVRGPARHESKGRFSRRTQVASDRRLGGSAVSASRSDAKQYLADIAALSGQEAVQHAEWARRIAIHDPSAWSESDRRGWYHHAVLSRNNLATRVREQDVFREAGWPVDAVRRTLDAEAKALASWVDLAERLFSFTVPPGEPAGPRDGVPFTVPTYARYEAAIQARENDRSAQLAERARRAAQPQPRMPDTLKDSIVVARTIRPHAEQVRGSLAADAARWPGGEPILGLLLEAEQEAREMRGALINLSREEQAHRAAGWDAWVLDDELRVAAEAVERLCAAVQASGQVVVGPGIDPDPRPLRVETPAEMDAREAWEAHAIAQQAAADSQRRKVWRIIDAAWLASLALGLWMIVRFALSDHGETMQFGAQPGLAIVITCVFSAAFIVSHRAKTSAGWNLLYGVWRGSAAAHATFRAATPVEHRTGRKESAATAAGAAAGLAMASHQNERRRATGQYTPHDPHQRAQWERERALDGQRQRDAAAPPGQGQQ
jgi:hypothetical protein